MNNISLGEAFAHVTKSSSYWVFIIFAVLILGFYLYMLGKDKIKDDGKLLFVVIAILMASIFYRPVEVAANTTKDQAAKGIYIGY